MPKDTIDITQNYLFRLEQLRSELAEAEADLQLSRVQRNQLQSQLEKGTVSKTATEIVGAEQQLKDLRARFTKQHPDVVAQRRKIAALRADGGVTPAEEAQARLALAGKGGISRKEYEAARLKLSEVEALYSAGAERVRRLRNRIDRITLSASKVPEVEAQMARLNRDYDILKSKHSEFVSRREQAKISKEQEVGSERVKYEIVDPPRVPAIADGPSRTILITGVLAVALAAGLGFTVLLSYVNSTFADSSQLRKMFGMTVLGTVSKVQSLTRQTWQLAKFSVFAASTFALFGAYGVIMLMETRVGWKNIISIKIIEDLYNQAMSMIEMI